MNVKNLIRFCVRNTLTVQRKRQALFDEGEKVIIAKEKLEEAKRRALLENKIDGKNAEIREAQLQDLLAPLYNDLALAELNEKHARLELDQVLDERDLARTLTRLCQVEDGE